MRITPILLLAPFMLAANAPDTPTPIKRQVVKRVCQNALIPATDGVLTDARPAPARKLGDLPPAKQQLAVIRNVDGCAQPTVIRDNIGGR